MQLGSPADIRRRFRTGRHCLDLVHTGGEGKLARWEIINDADDLGRLIGVILGLPPLPANEADLAATRSLRTAVTRIAYDLAAGPPPPIPIDPPQPDDIATVNAAAAAPPLVHALLPEGGATVVAPTTAAAIATIARDAIDLFGGQLAHRIRVCAADNCGLLLVDASKPGRRRWCSMQLCGNRAKSRTHRTSTPGRRCPK